MGKIDIIYLMEAMTELRDEAYKDACKKGLHDKEYSCAHWMMLAICEVAEVIEADRRDKHAKLIAFDNDFHECGVKSWAYTANVMNTVEDELADVCIIVLDYMGLHDIDVDIDPDICEQRRWGSYIVRNDDLARHCLDIVNLLVHAGCPSLTEENLNSVLNMILAWCMNNSIDILRHIRLKIDYNKTREGLNGKRY